MKKTTLNIPKDVHQQFKMLSVQQERDMSEIVTEALEQYLKDVAKAKRRV